MHPHIHTPRSSRLLPACILALMLAAACSGDATGRSDRIVLAEGVSPSADIVLSADSLRLWVGDEVQLTAEWTGPGRPAVRWESAAPGIFTVDAQGRVTAVSRGSGVLQVSIGPDRTQLTVTSLPVIRGRVHSATADDRGVLRAHWRVPGGADSAQVAADGAFTIRASTLATEGELLIDGPSPRAYHPFLYPFHVDSLADVDVVAVPRAWTIRRGLYAGLTVPISLDLVMEEQPQDYFFSYFFGEPGADAYLTELNTWPMENFPAKLVIDHKWSEFAWTAEDSIAMWRTFNRMEEIFGIDMFEPATADSAWWPEYWSETQVHPPGVIRIGYWGGGPGAGTLLIGETPEVWTQELGSWAGGGRFTRFRVTRRYLNAGWTELGGVEPYRYTETGELAWVAPHEMLHVLGVGHTCRIPSPQGRCMRTMEPTQYDVAYMELLREQIVLERAHDTFLGIMPATIGERRVMLNLPTLPTFQPR